MNLQTLENGSRVCTDDPGEPATGKPRLSITQEEGMLLRWLAKDKRVLEIGTGLGVSTEWLASSAFRVDTVDTDPWVWEHVFASFPVSPTLRCYRDRINLPERDYDMVFIDGNHTTDDTAADVAFARSVCPRGVIAVHDAKIDKVRVALDGFGIADTEHGIGFAFVGWTA